MFLFPTDTNLGEWGTNGPCPHYYNSTVYCKALNSMHHKCTITIKASTKHMIRCTKTAAADAG